MIVVDTSVVLAVLLIEPERPAILKCTRGKRILAAPSLGWEVGNVLVALVRRRRTDFSAVERAWRSFGRIPLAYADCNIAAALRLATEAGLSAYDAYVIETARAAGAPLLTLDKKQRAVAAERGVDILEIA